MYTEFKQVSSKPAYHKSLNFVVKTPFKTAASIKSILAASFYCIIRSTLSNSDHPYLALQCLLLFGKSTFCHYEILWHRENKHHVLQLVVSIPATQLLDRQSRPIGKGSSPESSFLAKCDFAGSGTEIQLRMTILAGLSSVAVSLPMYDIPSGFHSS